MKLTDKIHLLKIDFEISLSPDKKTPRYVNVLLVLSDKVTLIDTGVRGSEAIIFNYLKKQNRDSSEIDKIILSHSHPDHIGSAATVKELTNCRLFAHELEKEWIENIELQNKQRPVPGFYNLVNKPVKVDEYISDNQKMLIGEGVTIKFTKSSGHSMDSLNMLFEEDKILFTADSIPLKNDIPNYYNYFELMESLGRIKANTGFETLLTSWTHPLTDRKEIKELIKEGEEYMKRVDSAVNECYMDSNTNSLDYCRKTVGMLGLPPFLVNPIVDKAFKSHLSGK